MGSPVKTLIKGGILALPSGPARMDLFIEGQTISQIGEDIHAADAQSIDATGCTVLPGAIDAHTHLDLPVSGTVTADDFASGTRAAILGGTTTIIDYATQDRGHTLHEAFNTWQQRMQGNLFCDVALHMAITDWNEQTSDEISDMLPLGISSYKMYMAYASLRLEDDAIYKALCRIREVGGIACFHCENGRLVDALVQAQMEKGHHSSTAHPLSRPPEVEAEAIYRLLRIAQLADVAVYIVHLSSKQGLSAIHQARRPQQKVYVETCPQYLLLTDALYQEPDGEKYVCSPPLRKQEDADALWRAIAMEEIDVVATDHCSFRYADQKRPFRNDFTRIPNGLPGVEHRLPIMMTEGVETGRLTLTQLVRLLSENPARIFGLYPQKGTLSVGSDADIVIWDPRRSHRITAAHQAQNVDYTPYEGRYVSGGIRDCFLRGQYIVQNGCLPQYAFGQYVYKNVPYTGTNEKN